MYKYIVEEVDEEEYIRSSIGEVSKHGLVVDRAMDVTESPIKFFLIIRHEVPDALNHPAVDCNSTIFRAGLDVCS